MANTVARSALLVLVVSLPIATWWIVPVVSHPRATDYMIEPLPLSARQQNTAGGVALVLVAVAAAMVFSAPGRRSLRRHEREASVPLVVAGLYTGTAYQIATSPTIGANIGGGLLVLVGYLAVPGLIVADIWRWRSQVEHAVDQP
ncbi:MAG: hypothetical protein AAGA65_30750 [Actinomycetota bacterium]